MSSLSSQEPSGAQVFILNIEVFQFEVRSSLSEGHGVEENLKKSSCFEAWSMNTESNGR